MLSVPKSDVEVVRGMKSREKTVKIDSTSLAAPVGKGKSNLSATVDSATLVWTVKELLEKGVDGA